MHKLMKMLAYLLTGEIDEYDLFDYFRETCLSKNDITLRNLYPMSILTFSKYKLPSLTRGLKFFQSAKLWHNSN